jgi:hypothetical protein
MRININLHKTLEVLSKTNMSYLTILLAFASSFNLWFLSIYFFNNGFIVNHGLLITLLTTFALTVSWCLLVWITVVKFETWIDLNSSIEVDENSPESSKLRISLFMFAEIILAQSLVLYFEYLFRWNFQTLVSVQFLLVGIQFLFLDIFLKMLIVPIKKIPKQ